jgi:hypothetical protein
MHYGLFLLPIFHKFILNTNRTGNIAELKSFVSSGLRVFISEADELCAVGCDVRQIACRRFVPRKLEGVKCGF